LVTEDGLKIIAKIDGVVVKEGTRVSIISQLIVSGDVDYHTGNIEDFVDAVQIMGTVREGFKVKAKNQYTSAWRCGRSATRSGTKY